MKAALFNLLDSVGPWLAASGIGGAIDYVNQIHRGDRKWSLVGFFAHLSAALFFGWLCGSVAAGFGYAPSLVYAAAGMGGFLGVRVADLATYFFNKTR